jgi:predicted small metal-binding protein
MKTLHCRDTGFDCEGIIRANTEDEVLGQAAIHAKQAHGMDATPEMADQLRRLIREE